MVLYQISFPEPGSHLVAVRLRFVAIAATTELWIAAWTPGSYLIREYARNLRTLTATVAGQTVTPTRLGKDAWQIASEPGQPIEVTYHVYAHELSVRGAHHDLSHAFLHPAQIYLIPAGIAGPCRVEITLPPRWRAVSLVAKPTLEHTEADLFTVTLADIDSLLDTPIEVGALYVTPLPAPCDHVRVAVWGEPLPASLLPRLATVVRQVEATWPSRAHHFYTFIVHAVVGAVGGLEHLHGSVLGISPEPLATGDGDGTLDCLELVAHELFHAWNGKRLRPRGLGPFDYRRECYTPLLWWVEGVTSYYDRLSVLRSGEMSVEQYLTRTTRDLNRLAEIPGQTVQSLTAASHDAWIKLYRPQDDSPNATVSYYLKGSLVAFQLDLWLRHCDVADGLDAVLHALWTREQCRGLDAAELFQAPGFTAETLLACIADVAGREVPAWLRGLWERPGSLLLQYLECVGLELREHPASDGPSVELGFATFDRSGALGTKFVLDHSPAQAAGLAANDELLAARCGDGPWLRLSTSRAATVWGHLKPDTPSSLLICRRERVSEISVTFAPRRIPVALARQTTPDTTQHQRFAQWSHRPWTTP